MSPKRRARIAAYGIPAYVKIRKPREQKYCRCCHRARNDGELFSLNALCEDCSVIHLVASIMGMDYADHWVEGPNGERFGWHTGKIDKHAA